LGTFEEEKEEVKYGITQNINSWNPAWANWHYYHDMWKLFRKAPNLWLKLKVFFAKPGWDPITNSIPNYSVDLNRRVYDTQTSKSLQKYVMVQFCLAIFALSAFMWFFYELSWFFRISNSILILLTGVICGGVFENKNWVYKAEYLRLFWVLINLNVLYLKHFPNWFSITFIASLLGFVFFIIWFYKSSLQSKVH